MGTLILQDGSVLKGESIGAIGGWEGEIVFNTSTVGYQEILTNPSCAKQIVVMTYPEIGNTGINDYDFESDNVHLVGMIAKSFCKEESHYQSRHNIAQFLKDKNVIALEGIDTRSLVKKIRECGTMSAFITSNDLEEEFIKEKLREIQTFKMPKSLINEVSAKGRYIYNSNGKYKIACFDFGIQKSILKSLAKRDCKITVYPANTTAQEILDNDFDAVFLSNGPGNPADYKEQIDEIKKLMGKIPVFGVCLGCQLLAIAAGARTYKLKYGHRGANYPIVNLENNKIISTSQNHGFAISSEELPKFIRPTYKNLNDDTIEGFEIISMSVYATQFHPEASSQDNDASRIYDEWVNIIKKDVNRINEVTNEK